MAIAYVQDVGSYTDTAAATSHSIAITNAPSVGSHLLVWIVCPGSVSSISAADSLSALTWTTRDVEASGSTLTMALIDAYVGSALGTSDTIDITLNSSQGMGASVLEYSGGDSAGWFDVFAAYNSGGVSETTWFAGPTATTSQADAMVVGALATSATAGTITVDQTGMTARQTAQSTDFVRTVYPYDEIVSATGTYSFSGSHTSARQNAAIVAVYKSGAPAVAAALTARHIYAEV